MSQQKAASLTSSLFARKGRASPASLLISELETGGAEAPEAKGHRPSANGPSFNGRAGETNGRRKPKPAADLPLLAFVEAQTAAEEPAPEDEVAPAVEPAPAASLLDRGARSLHRVNGQGTPTAAPVATAIPVEVTAEATAVAAGGTTEREIAAEFDAEPEDVVEAEVVEAEIVSGDANVAAIEDAPQDEPDTAPAAEDRAEGEPLAAAAETTAEAPDPAVPEPAATTAELAAEPAPAAAADRAAPAMPASLAMRKAAAMHSLPGMRAEPVPPARSLAARSHTVAWRSAAVVALGAALGLGFYLMLGGEPAAPPIALAPAAAPASTTTPTVVATVEPALPAAVAEPVAPAPVAETAAAPALPEPSFDIIRIEPDGQSIIAGRALPDSEWILLNNGSPIASVRADANGEWVVLPDAALVPGANAFSLVAKAERGRVTIPAPAAISPAPADLAPVPAEPAPASDAEAVAGPRAGAAAEPAPALPRPKPQIAAAVLPEPQNFPGSFPEAFRAAAEGAYEVQLASVRQSADADRERLRLSGAFPDLLGAMDLRVQQASLEGAGIFYRVRSGAIDDLGIARELCRRLEAAGQGCLVVRRPEAQAEAPVSDVAAELPDAAAAVRQQAERP